MKTTRRKRWLAITFLLGLMAAASCGASAQPTAKRQGSRSAVPARATAALAAAGPGNAGSIPRARALGMVTTPRGALAHCLQSDLLRPICPRRIPGAVHPKQYSVADGCENAAGITNASSRCTLPAWSYESSSSLPGIRPGTAVRAWDGREWFRPSYAAMDFPPYHVHVDLEAARGGPPPAVYTALRGARHSRVTDLLLNPRRSHGVSFGHVRWYGLDGQLLFAATGEEAGEQSGHLIFYFSVGHAYYDVSLHAWAAKERLRGRHVHRVDTDGQAGAALPHVIATLKAVVRSIALAR